MSRGAGLGNEPAGGTHMKRRVILTLAFVLVGFAGTQPEYQVAGQGAWTTLLDGKSLKGWDVVGNANWSVAEGAVQANMGNGFLVSPMSYGDFEVTAEFWVTDDANSGIFIRCSDPKTINAMNAYEVNIFDKRPDQAYRTGAIVDVAKPSVMTINTGGKWNTMTVTAKGAKMTVTVNGTKTVDVENSLHARGPIALQYGAGTVKWRSVKIRTL
jgi:3-keto-disaccharide hydrolase